MNIMREKALKQPEAWTASSCCLGKSLNGHFAVDNTICCCAPRFPCCRRFPSQLAAQMLPFLLVWIVAWTILTPQPSCPPLLVILWLVSLDRGEWGLSHYGLSLLPDVFQTGASLAGLDWSWKRSAVTSLAASGCLLEHPPVLFILLYLLSARVFSFLNVPFLCLLKSLSFSQVHRAILFSDTTMPFFTFTLHHTVIRGAAQYDHCLLLVATGSCPVQSSWRVTASLPSRFLSGSLTSLWFCFLCPSVCSIFHPSSSFVVFHPSLFLSLHLSVLFFPFILSRFLSPSPAVPHGLYLPRSLSVSITFSSLPYPFVSPKPSFLIGFVFLLACLALSASVWVLFPPFGPSFSKSDTSC